MHRAVALAAAFLIPASGSITAQSFSGGYPLYLPADDTSTVADLPAFAARTIGPAEFVSIDAGGHFAVNGQRLRLFGTNCVADGAFPMQSSVWWIAGRLRKMGFNLVRFHHMDNGWTSGSLFEQGSDTRHLNLSTLDRLEFFLAGLKKNGIYADINLNVSRTFRKSDGIPEADSLGDFAKGFTLFDPLLISLQKEFARQLLTHISPYTGLSLAQDPVMGMVETTNENSLFLFWRAGRLKPFSAGGVLPVRHERLLDSLFQSMLSATYATTPALAASWNAGQVAEGQNFVVNGGFDSEPWPGPWTLEIHDPARATVGRDTAAPRSAPLAGRVSVTAADGAGWHLQFKNTGLSVVKDSVYTVRFAARADSARSIDVTVMLDISPWTWAGGSTVILDTVWHSYELTVRAPETWTNTVRLSFGVGYAAGTYWFDDVSMVRTGLKGLLPGESLEHRSVQRIDYADCGGYTDARVRDMTAFYIGVQRAYFTMMRSFLHDSLGVRVPVVGTNLNWGLPDVASQDAADYIDNHAYWDHPSFPSTPWSATDWTMTNTPMVRTGDGGTIGNLMTAVPVMGKPFTISEYNHPFPNRYQTEGLLFLTAYASFHGADAIMFFDYNGGSDWTTDMVSTYFDLHRNSAMMALMPSLALAFRAGFVSPARQTIALRWTEDDVLITPKRDNSSWWQVGIVSIPQTVALEHAVRTASFSAAASSAPLQEPSPPFVSDTREIVWDPSGALTVGAPAFAAVTGFPENLAAAKAGDLALPSSGDHMTVTWVSLENLPLPVSRHSLLTVATRIENTGMVWDGTNTLHDRWGSAPTLLKPAFATLKLHLRADSIRIVPLSVTGNPLGGSWTILPSDTNLFQVTVDQLHTPWFGVDAYGPGFLTGVQAAGRKPGSFVLEQNYPNPFNPTTLIRAQWPVASRVHMTVYDLLGRVVAVLLDGVRPAGETVIPFDGTGLGSGVYFCRLRAVPMEPGWPAYSQVRSMTLLK